VRADAQFHADLAALAWQVELGVDEAIAEAPIDRFAEAAAPRAAPVPPPPAVAAALERGAAARGAADVAAACQDLASLRDALASFEGSALKRGARNLVFADGIAGARVMVIGEAPGREEDAEGRPFVGRSGRLLDRMLAAIGLSRAAATREEAVYIANVLPWRPPGDRDPAGDEAALLKPFLFRHIELAAPEAIVLMGSAAARAVLETEAGVMRLRGRWGTWRGVPALPMVHPASLLRDPTRKRLAWADLLTLRAWLDGESG
jgi:uracil-DNA glycosylase